MIIYKDILSGDEAISDSFRMKEVDGLVYEVDCRTFPWGSRNDESFDIGASPVRVDEHGNLIPVEKEPESASLEPRGDGKSTELDIERYFQYNDEYEMNQRSTKEAKEAHFLPAFKAYLKRIAEALKANGTDEATIKFFQKGAAKYYKKISANVMDWDFYQTQSVEPDGMLVVVNFREDGITPYAVFFKHGLTEMKL